LQELNYRDALKKTWVMGRFKFYYLWVTLSISNAFGFVNPGLQWIIIRD